MKKSLIIALAIVLLIIILISVGMFMVQSPDKYKIVETKQFSASDGSFSFSYPIFKGWEFKSMETSKNNDRWIIYLDWPNSIEFEIATRIVVEKLYKATAVEYPTKIEEIKKVNDNEYYIYTSDGFDVRITLSSVSEKHGFSREAFWKAVTSSFKLGGNLEDNAAKNLFESERYR